MIQDYIRMDIQGLKKNSCRYFSIKNKRKFFKNMLIKNG